MRQSTSDEKQHPTIGFSCARGVSSPTSRSAYAQLYRLGVENTENANTHKKYDWNTISSDAKPTQSTCFRSQTTRTRVPRRSGSTGGLLVLGTSYRDARVSPISVSSRGLRRTWDQTRVFNKEQTNNDDGRSFCNTMTRQTQTNALSRLWGFLPLFHRTLVFKCPAQWS